ncbi:probable cytochrome P450 49a1 isoform X2 [Penaeus japonicus]|uniref:probable cytochrome P450 49a1 isoform X2 n=1 Tax=Penaeus japonicus TaxID=27405 RepID=UPI001C710EC6|nr:probable cytochrome P450 49a1 isoform X2 [Penaeus japonicus]
MMLRTTQKHAGTCYNACLTRAAVAGAGIRHQTTCSAQPRPKSDVPGPRRWPFLQSLPYVVAHKDDYKDRLYVVYDKCVKEFGPLFRLQMPGQKPRVFVTDPKDIEHILQVTAKDPRRIVCDPWKEIRDSHPFFVSGQAGIVGDWANMRDEKSELPADFDHELCKWFLEALGVVYFNKNFGCLEGNEESLKIIDMPESVFKCIHNLEISSGVWSSWFYKKEFKKLTALHEGLFRFINKHVSIFCDELKARGPTSDEEPCMVEKMLQDPRLTYQDVHAYLIDSLLGGIHSSSLAFAFVLLGLAQHPEAQTKLQEELDTVLGDPSEPVTAHHLARLSYTKACFKEALRLNKPTAVIMREVVEDTVLRDFLLPKGLHVYLYVRPAGLDEEYFPRASEFLPERWLRHRPLGPVNALASLNFGFGRRNCVAQRMAEAELYILLIRILQKYHLRWQYGAINPTLKFVFLPDKPLRLTMTERS